MRNLGLALASALAVTLVAPRVHADPLRIVVLEFSGPEGIKDDARRLVVNIIKDDHEVVSVARFAVAARRLGVDAFSPRSIPSVARQAGIDAVIQGKISDSGEKRTLSIAVIEARTGNNLNSLTVPVVKGELKTEARAQIADGLVDILEGVSALSPLDQELAGGTPAMLETGPAKPVALALSTPTGEEAASTGAPEDTPLVEAPKKTAPSLFRVIAQVGVMTTKRSLSFVADPSLSADMQPQGIDGNPGAAVALSMIGQVPSIGLSGDLSYERSIGTRVGYKDAGVTKNLSVSQRQLAAILRYTKSIRKIGVHFGAGYREVAYLISGKPGSLTIPDCRYAFLDLGAGFRLPFNKDRFALSADAAYLYALASSGITDADSYGRAGVAGWRGDLAMEFKATENTTIRAGVNYLHVSLAFEGSGELQHSLNGPNGFDVAAASDGYLGGYVLVGFLL